MIVVTGTWGRFCETFYYSDTLFIQLERSIDIGQGGKAMPADRNHPNPWKCKVKTKRKNGSKGVPLSGKREKKAFLGWNRTVGGSNTEDMLYKGWPEKYEKCKDLKIAHWLGMTEGVYALVERQAIRLSARTFLKNPLARWHRWKLLREVVFRGSGWRD